MNQVCSDRRHSDRIMNAIASVAYTVHAVTLNHYHAARLAASKSPPGLLSDDHIAGKPDLSFPVAVLLGVSTVIRAFSLTTEMHMISMNMMWGSGTRPLLTLPLMELALLSIALAYTNLLPDAQAASGKSSQATIPPSASAEVKKRLLLQCQWISLAYLYQRVGHELISCLHDQREGAAGAAASSAKQNSSLRRTKSDSRQPSGASTPSSAAAAAAAASPASAGATASATGSTTVGQFMSAIVRACTRAVADKFQGQNVSLYCTLSRRPDSATTTASPPASSNKSADGTSSISILFSDQYSYRLDRIIEKWSYFTVNLMSVLSACGLLPDGVEAPAVHSLYPVSYTATQALPLCVLQTRPFT